MECEKWKLKHTADANGIYRGLGLAPRKISRIRSSESIFLDTSTVLLKQLALISCKYIPVKVGRGAGPPGPPLHLHHQKIYSYIYLVVYMCKNS